MDNIIAIRNLRKNFGREVILDDVNLVRNLGTTEDRDEWPLRIRDGIGKVLHFLLHEKTNDAWFADHGLRNGNHRSVGAVTCAKGIVAVDIGEPSQLSGEDRIALLLALIKTQVFQQHNIAALQGSDFRDGICVNSVGRKSDRLAQQ